MNIPLLLLLIIICTQQQCLSYYEYNDFNTGNCLPCGISCISCFDSVICTQCVSEYYLSNNQCQKCSFGCSICSSASSCSTCNDGLYLTSSGACLACGTGVATCTIATVQSCSENYFMLGTICAGCLTNCKTCSDFVTCSTCALSYYLDASGSSCLPCPNNCRICTSSTNCFECDMGYTQNGSGCTPFSCTTIDPFCISCANGFCLSCQSGKYLLNGVCSQGGSLLCLESTGPYYTDCVTSSYGCQSYSVIQTQNGNQMTVCLPVIATKLNEYTYSTPTYTCSGSCTLVNIVTISYSTSQTYYQLNYYLKIRFYSTTTARSLTVKLLDENNTILTSQTTSVDISQEITTYNQVDSGCLNCIYGEKVVSGSLSYSAGQYPTNFTVTDSAGMVQVTEMLVEHEVCQVDYCSSCSSAVDCSACFSPYYLQLSTCVSTCDSGFYLYGQACYLTCPSGTYTVTSSYSCSVCVFPCLTCSSSSACLTCQPNYFLESTSCLSTCSSTYLFANSTSQACQSCPNPCVTCSISNNTVSCLSCAEGYLYSNGSCVYICPWGEYGNYINSTSQCLSCSAACSNCYINSYTCSSCNSGYLLINTTCQLMVSCPSTYYIDSSLNRCLACHYPCATCSVTQSNCTSCSKGVLSGSSCLNTCPSAEYPDYTTSSNVTCVTCTNNCLTCQSSTSCLSCNNNTYLSSDACVSTCPDGTYPNSINNTCSNCLPPCKTCTTASSCLTCSSGYLDGTSCTLQCNSSSYIDPSFTCTPCVSPCTSCHSATSCLSCSIPYLFFNNTCIDLAACNNQTGYYAAYSPNATSATQATCSSCTFPCLTCQNNSVTCTSCQTNYYFVLQTSKCLSSCPDGYYVNGSNCEKCNSNCYLCSVTATNCTNCASGMYLDTTTTTCTSTCPATYYPDDQSQQCLACASPCNQCYSLYLCITCSTGILFSKTCVTSCPSSTYLNASINTCVGCTNSCLTCSGTSSTCLSCSNGYYLFNSSCSTTCPDNYYANDYTNTCDGCVSPCLTCSSSSACLSCQSGYYYLNNQCLTACSTSYYADSNSSLCLSCNLTICLTCTGSANGCLTCNTGYYMYNGSCTNFCPSGYYPNSVKGTCDGCPFPCATCSNYTFCTSCLTSYYIFSDRCFSACPLSYYPDNSSLCQPCGANCQSCISATSCTQCSTNYLLLNSSCTSPCPTGMYAGTQSITNYDQCQSCQSDCMDCSAYDYCLTCQTSLIQFNGLCLSSCPIFYYPDANGTCQQCSQYCTTCTNSSFCTACIGSYLHNNACITTCPSETYPLSGTSCSPCISPCLQCTGDYTCTSCLTGYIYFHNYCVTSCPSDIWYYPHNNSCSSSCPYNKLASNLTCYIGTCGNFMVALNGYCLTECSTGYYVNNNQECTLCEQGAGICGNLFLGNLEIVYTEALTLVLYLNQEAEVPAIGDISINFVDIDGNTVSRTLNSYELTAFKMEFIFDRTATSLVNITLTIPYISSMSSNQRVSANSYKAELPTYQDYSSYQAPSFISLIPLFLFAILMCLIIINVANKSSRFVQILDFIQLVAVTLYLDIQYPPVLQSFLSGFRVSLFAAKNLLASTPYIFSPPKFIYYHVDTSLFRTEAPLFLVFILTFTTFMILIAIHTYNPQRLRKAVRLIRYRLLNDLFSICMTPLFLFACQFQHQPSMLLAISIFLILLGVCYVAWISFKIIQVKKLSELSGLLGDFERTESKIGLMYTPFAFIRRIIFTIGLGIAPYEPIATITLLLVLTFLIMICIYFYQPFDNQYTDYVTIFMESSLTIYVACLIVLGLNVMDPTNSHNMGVFCLALLLITIVLCLAWLTYLTVQDIRTKGCCPKMKEDDKDGRDDYSQKKYDQDQDQIRKMEGLQPLHKDKKQSGGKQQEQKDSANELINRFGSGGFSEQLFSGKQVEGEEEFRHWTQDSSEVEQIKISNVRESKLPHLMIKVERNQKEEEPAESQNAIN